MHQICKLVYAVKNSSTIILPQWYCILKSLSLKAQVIPHDIHTCWNATYNMLDFAYQYKKAINKITDTCIFVSKTQGANSFYFWLSTTPLSQA